MLSGKLGKLRGGKNHESYKLDNLARNWNFHDIFWKSERGRGISNLSRLHRRATLPNDRDGHGRLWSSRDNRELALLVNLHSDHDGELSMETLGLFGAAAVFFSVGFAMVLYELARIKAKRPILKGRQMVQIYYVTYLTMFVLALITGLKAIIG
jgi:hypothetical protein